METSNHTRSLLIDSVRAHAMRFENPLAPTYKDAVGTRVLVAFLIVAVGVFYTLRVVLDAAVMRGSPTARLGFVLILIVAFVAVQRVYVRAPMTDIGLRPLAAWRRRERLYLLQVVPLASVVFAIVFRDHLLALAESHGVVGFTLFSVLTGLGWGMVQEFLYRGWLQTELTRRFGTLVGLLAANVVFTFGLLHLNYLVAPEGVRWAGLAAVFGIGLVFGIVYHRSGNLWIPAVLHGIWPLNMT